MVIKIDQQDYEKLDYYTVYTIWKHVSDLVDETWGDNPVDKQRNYLYRSLLGELSSLLEHIKIVKKIEKERKNGNKKG